MTVQRLISFIIIIQNNNNNNNKKFNTLIFIVFIMEKSGLSDDNNYKTLYTSIMRSQN